MILCLVISLPVSLKEWQVCMFRACTDTLLVKMFKNSTNLDKMKADKSDINGFITIYSAPRHITSLLLTTEMYKQTELFTFMYSILALPLSIRASSKQKRKEIMKKHVVKYSCCFFSDHKIEMKHRLSK